MSRSSLSRSDIRRIISRLIAWWKSKRLVAMAFSRSRQRKQKRSVSGTQTTPLTSFCGIPIVTSTAVPPGAIYYIGSAFMVSEGSFRTIESHIGRLIEEQSLFASGSPTRVKSRERHRR